MVLPVRAAGTDLAVTATLALLALAVTLTPQVYLPLFDARWFFEMVGGGKLVTPFDLSSWSQLINVAGTAPTAADMRGTTVQGAEREFGALEATGQQERQ